MKVVKPLRLSVLHRPFRWQGQNHLGVSVLALADMGASPRLRPEPELWQLAGEELQLNGGVLDLAIPKACAEFLATGNAYTHHQNDKTACAVKIQLDTLEKTLVVFGDRHWLNHHPSAPLPFEEMRLDWRRAFGGPHYGENPHGIGATPETFPHGKVHPLPNIEPLNGRMTSPRQNPLPAGFDALDFTWPRRFARIGKKYDDAWLNNEFPGFASDIDWRLFNMAESDQQFTQHDTLPAGAEYAIWNMHPQQPVQRGQLPSWRTRCFINRQRGDKELFEEIAMRHTTVWFFPHREQMLLIYQGSARINEDDAADVLQLMPALETLGAPRSPNHYRKVLRQRIEKEKGALFAFREKDLLPETAIGPWVDTQVPEHESPILRNATQYQQHVRQTFREQMHEGQDIADVLPISTRPALDQLPEYVEQLEQQAEQLQQDLLATLGDAALAAREQEPLTRGHENYQQMRDFLYQQPPEADPQRLAENEQALYQTYLLTAHEQGAALRLTGDLAQIIRNRVAATMAGDKNFNGIDLTGADLSGMDLRHADFSQCLLESADLSRCRLDHANFHQAMLARADLSAASLQYATLDKASLALAQCKGSDFSHASLLETNLQETLFSQCNFTSARLEQLILHRTFLSGCRFTQATLSNITLMGLTLSDLSFHQAQLSKLTFMRCRCEHFDLQHARLNDCSWVESQVDHIRFIGARLLNCAFVHQTELAHADFSDAQLKQCNLRQLPLVQACFRRARLDNTDLSEAILTAGDLEQMNGNHSLFIRCDFSGANLKNASLIGALMQKCQMSGADLRGANLFRADLSQSRIDNSTLIDGAYTQRTKTLPRASRELV
ncbi:DUF2169 domain-containing protein [Serratia quinivorans]|uniref:DUF2169 family type VI secretion system accessory protein n=1 Tax=Serratia quinivorans TaxID=137545 RepID=UPI003F9C0F50